MFQYKKFNFRESTIKMIEQANEIIAEYRDEDYDLTLRQLYYQFVARRLIDNKDTEYKRLGGVINDGRLAGLIDWESIVDRTRARQANTHWTGPGDIIEAAASTYRIDTRVNQSTYIEVWVEKDALAAVVERACIDLDVPFMSCRGYVSQSAMWEASVGFYNEEKERDSLILHLGDHDPSGIDMTRDIQDRLVMFGCSCHVERIALNMDQIERYNPPPNPAKITDSRYERYMEEYGEESWELDALDPRVIEELINAEVGKNTDQENRCQRLLEQKRGRKKLKVLAESWNNGGKE